MTKNTSTPSILQRLANIPVTLVEKLWDTRTPIAVYLLLLTAVLGENSQLSANIDPSGAITAPALILGLSAYAMRALVQTASSFFSTAPGFTEASKPHSPHLSARTLESVVSHAPKSSAQLGKELRNANSELETKSELSDSKGPHRNSVNPKREQNRPH